MLLSWAFFAHPPICFLLIALHSPFSHLSISCSGGGYCRYCQSASRLRGQPPLPPRCPFRPPGNAVSSPVGPHIQAHQPSPAAAQVPLSPAWKHHHAAPRALTSRRTLPPVRPPQRQPTSQCHRHSYSHSHSHSHNHSHSHSHSHSQRQRQRQRRRQRQHQRRRQRQRQRQRQRRRQRRRRNCSSAFLHTTAPPRPHRRAPAAEPSTSTRSAPA